MIARTTKLVPPAKSVGVSLCSSAMERNIDTSQFIELEGKGNSKKEQLISDRDQQSDSQIVIIENMDFCHAFEENMIQRIPLLRM